MTNIRSYTFILAIGLGLSAFGQIRQDHPELCGRAKETVVLPREMTAITVNGETKLVASLAGAKVQFSLGYVDEVQQVCEVIQEKLVVFSLLNGGAYDVAIVDRTAGRVADSFWARDPLISPDHRWIAYRDFYAPQSELSTSEEYLVYDLSKGPKENQLVNPVTHTVEARGMVMYPAVPNSIPFNNLGLPDHQIHQFRSQSFYWGADSKSVVFADSVKGGLSVIWVRIGEAGDIEAHVHPVSFARACEVVRDPDHLYLTLSSAYLMKVNSQLPEVRVEFSSPTGACSPKPMVLHVDDFKRAQVEKHAPFPPRRPAVRKRD
jgi:hypothetical protein